MDRLEAAGGAATEEQHLAVKPPRASRVGDSTAVEREARIAELLARGGLRAAAAVGKAPAQLETPSKPLSEDAELPQEANRTT